MDIEFERGQVVRTGLLVLAFVVVIFALTRWADSRMRAGS
jgi:hypothetical protein